MGALESTVIKFSSSLSYQHVAAGAARSRMAWSKNKSGVKYDRLEGCQMMFRQTGMEANSSR